MGGIATGLRVAAFASLFLLARCAPQISPATAPMTAAALPTSSTTILATATLPPNSTVAPPNPTAVASATIAVHSLSSAVAAYKATPDQAHAQEAKDKSDEAKAAAIAVGAGTPALAALIAALQAMGPAAEAAVANPGASTASQLEDKQKDVDDAEDEVEKQETSSASASSTPSSSSSQPGTTVTGLSVIGHPINSPDKTAQSSLMSRILSSQEGGMACLTTFSLPYPTACVKPICNEGNNQLMGMNNTPDKWCFCGGRGPFSTIPQATTNYCDFSILPKSTISLTSHSTSVNTACTITTTLTSNAAGPSTQTYCTCGNVMAGYTESTTTDAAGTGYGVGRCALQTPYSTTYTTIKPTPTAAPFCGNFNLAFVDNFSNKEVSADEANSAVQHFCGKVPGKGDSTGGTPGYTLNLDGGGTARERFWFNKAGNLCTTQTCSLRECLGGNGFWYTDTGCGSDPVWYKTVVIQFNWSANQTGCSAKAQYDMPQGDSCLKPLNAILDKCKEGATIDQNAGAMRVDGGKGCIDLVLYGVTVGGDWHNGKKLPEEMGSAVAMKIT